MEHKRKWRSVAVVCTLVVGGYASAEGSVSLKELQSWADQNGVASAQAAPVKGAPQAVAAKAENVGACKVDLRYTAVSAGPLLLPVQFTSVIEGAGTMQCAVSQTEWKEYKVKVTGKGVAPGIRIPPFWDSTRTWVKPDANGNVLVYVKTSYRSADLQIPTPYRFIYGKEASATYYAVGGGAAGFSVEVSPGVNQNVELSGKIAVPLDLDLSLSLSLTQFTFTSVK